MTKHIIFVAGDGASGRIMVEGMADIRTQQRPVQTRLIVQKDGGTARLCRDESVPCDLVGRDEFSPALLQDAAVVVVGNSATAFQVECAANVAAFDRRIPVIRVFDHPLSTYHAHFTIIAHAWLERDRPPYVVTAISPKHRDEMIRIVPELASNIRCIGNPLHVQLERAVAVPGGLAASQKRVREHASVPDTEAPVIAVFLTGNEAHLREALDMVDGFARALGPQGGILLYDVHATVPERLVSEVGVRARGWRGCGVHLVVGMPQTDMIVAADVVFADLTSTTVERAVTYGIPVVCQAGPAAMENALLRDAHHRALSLCHVHGATGRMERPEDASALLAEVSNPSLQRGRQEVAHQSGLLPEPGAMQQLTELIFSTAL